MKKNKILWILLPVLGVLIIALIVIFVFLFMPQSKENKYYEQMETAQLYLDEMDYSNMIQAYEAAIELRPEDPDAYLALAEYYLEQEEYYNAISIAEKGYQNTGSRRLERLIGKIELNRIGQTEEELIIQTDSVMEAGEDSANLLIRNNVIGNLGEYCYQQYINEYGDADVEYISAQEGYRTKFKGLSAYAYFKNTDENQDAIDDITKKPLPLAKPYKVVIQNPQILFVGFEGYISNQKVGEIFNILPESVLVQEDNVYYLVFEYLDCKMKIETDADGNVCKEKPIIEMYPLNLVSDWREEEEDTKSKEDEKTVSNNTFVLGGQVYSYNITELIIYNEVLEDLSPLAKCEQLEYIVFYDCKISDLSPLSECTSLVELNLGSSYGSLELSHLANLPKLRYLGFHECTDIDDITCIYGLELDILHPCGSSVSIDQCLEYQSRYPDCEVWFDYYYPIRQ